MRSTINAETYYFNKYYENGADWYLKQFSDVAAEGVTLFEKTPTYYQGCHRKNCCRLGKWFTYLGLVEN